MNLLPIEMREVQNNQRQEKLDLIYKYQSKLEFSAISLAFFIVVGLYTFFVPTFGGIVTPIIAGIAALVFVQQTIRSYNYREFYKNGYRFMEGAYKAINKGLKTKD
jgi:hypothetical protein